MGGRLSWSLALVDDAGTGVVLTSIHGRSDARSYAKGLVDWECDQPLSPEEDAVVATARARARGEVAAPTPARLRAKVGRRQDPDADAAITEQVEAEGSRETVRETGDGARTA